MYKFVIAALLLIPTAHANQLEDLAASLDVGEYAELSVPSLAAMNWSYSEFYYHDSAVWDPAAKQLRVVSGTGSCCEGLRRYTLSVFDAESNEISGTVLPWSGPDHGYDGNAFGGGHHYFSLMSGQIFDMTGAAPVMLPALPWTVLNGGALAWHEGAQALIYIGKSSKIAYWRPGDTQWTPIVPPVTWGSDSAAAEYNRVHNVVWMGAGVKQFHVTADLTLVPLPDAPVTFSQAKAVHMTAPDGRQIVVQQTEGSSQVRKWWEADPLTGIFVRREDWDSLPINPLGRSVAHATNYEIGAILVLTHRQGERKLWVWKFTDGKEPPDDPPPLPGPDCIPREYLTEPPLPYCPLTITRCGQPGVFHCDEFSGEPKGTLNPGKTTPEVKDGNLVITIPSESPANAGGSYNVQFPGVETVYVAFRTQRDKAALEADRHGSKQFILWSGNTSCTAKQLAQTHHWRSGVVMPYTACGSPDFTLPMVDGDRLWQYPDYTCKRRSVLAGDTKGCVASRADLWATFYLEVKPDRVTLWHKPDGGEWGRYVDTQWTWAKGQWDHFMLTAYETGKDATLVHPPGTVRYDYLVMSTEPLDKALL